MIVNFWGTRGSCSSTGIMYSKYGGNTSCVSLEVDSGKHLILDAGTGLKYFSEKIIQDTKDIYLLLSHTHWDHIQGIPFFSPIYKPGTQIHFYAPDSIAAKICVYNQFDGIRFPIREKDLPSTCIVEPNLEFTKSVFGLDSDAIQTDHPGDCLAYRFISKGKKVVYMPDNQLHSSNGGDSPLYSNLLAFVKNANLLIHDAQFTESDMPQKNDWGHSLVMDLMRFSLKAEVKKVVLFHHDPNRTDDQIDQLCKQIKQYLYYQRSPLECIAAYDGLRLTV